MTTNGGTYVKNIERPVRVTHLLCGDECVISDNDPQGRKKSDKVKYAHKFNERKEANISIVWEEWFWDSIAFGGRFAEDEYLISKPRPKRKVMEGMGQFECHQLRSSLNHCVSPKVLLRLRELRHQAMRRSHPQKFLLLHLRRPH